MGAPGPADRSDHPLTSEADGVPEDHRPDVTASIIIPAYSMARWDQLVKAVDSCQTQSRRPVEIIVCIDHNQDLLERSSERWVRRRSHRPGPGRRERFAQDHLDASAHQRAHGSKRRFGAGWARNTGAEIATGDVLVFLDDDAWAEPDWLERLFPPYADEGTVAVGGAPLPEYQTERPDWFPPNFDWVFGCAYEGLPTTLAPLAHLIGANMSVRREAFEKVEGFHSIDFDDLDLCMRVATAFPTSACCSSRGPSSIISSPRSVVVAWRYFWRGVLLREPREGRGLRRHGPGRQSQRRVDLRAACADRPDQGGARGGAAHGQVRRSSSWGSCSSGSAMAGLGNLAGRFGLWTEDRFIKR